MNDQTPKPPAAGANPKAIIIGGLAIILFFGYIMAFLLADVIQNARPPKPMTLSDAASEAADEQIWVAIEDGVYDCDSITYVYGRSATNPQVREIRNTEIFRTDETGEIVLFVTLSGRQSCQEIQNAPLKGYLTRMSAGQRQALTNEVRLAKYINASAYLEICGYCGPANSWLGLAISSVALLIGLALLVVGLRLRRHQQRE